MLDKFKKILKEKGEVYLRLKIFPGASISKIVKILEDDTIKINISASAEKGKANQELIKFLAKYFRVNRNNIKIISGAGSRIKLIKIKND